MGNDTATGSHSAKRASTKTIEDSEAAEYTERYNRYETEYVRRLKAKYFSNKTFVGGLIFEKEIAVDEEVIRASKDPPIKSFMESSFVGEDHKSPTSVGGEPENALNKKLQSRKNG